MLSFIFLQRFYQTLSEIKSEIENIIITGRKLVEEKSVTEPEKFSRRIDMLKELYNKVIRIISIYIFLIEYYFLCKIFFIIVVGFTYN